MPQNDIFERLRKHYELKLPFVAYRKPEASSGTAFFQRNDELYQTTDFSESGFVFAPFDNTKPAVLIPETAAEKVIFDTSEIGELPEKEERELVVTSEESKQRHISLVKKGILELTSGSMEKVVLSRKEKVELKDADPLKLFQKLLVNYPTAFVYIWFHPKVGLWLGATPETLLKIEGNIFKTMALAGTQKFTGSMEVDWGAKEKQEQQYVTDSILNDLERVGVSSSRIESSAAYTAKAGNLLHLKTDISGRMSSEVGVEKLISALHPTPAVCGLPKEKAKEFILAEENYDREFYTGFLGELNLQSSSSRSRNKRNVENLAYRTVKKESALFVNLRCMKLDNKAANLFIGGGITKDSVPEDEWQETVNKAGTMKAVISKMPGIN
jgi:isochorismate synthase